MRGDHTLGHPLRWRERVDSAVRAEFISAGRRRFDAETAVAPIRIQGLAGIVTDIAGVV